MKIVTEESFQIVLNTVNKLVNLVKPTFGPSENKIIIGKGYLTKVLDDSVQVVRDLQFDNEVENRILNVIREVPESTSKKVLDGTTGSLLELQAIMKQISQSSKQTRYITRELKQGLKEAIQQLRSKAKQIQTVEELEMVARTSYNDEKVAKLIADTVFKVGKDGLINVEKSDGFDVECSMRDGYEVKKGYISPALVNTNKDEVVIEKPYILVTDATISTNKQIVPLLNQIIKVDGTLAIFAKNIEGQALSTLVLNKLNGKVKSVAVNTTDYDDIALVTGATMYNAERGSLSDIKLEHLGRAEKIVSTEESTLIVGGTPNEQLASVLETATEERKAKLTNSVALIRVGANTDSEAEAIKAKVENAVNSTKQAYKGGYVKGGATSLLEIETSSEILNNALKVPHRVLVENMLELNYIQKILHRYGLKKYEVDIPDNVIDSVNVLIAGMESAVSTACLLCTVRGLVIEENGNN